MNLADKKRILKIKQKLLELESGDSDIHKLSEKTINPSRGPLLRKIKSKSPSRIDLDKSLNRYDFSGRSSQFQNNRFFEESIRKQQKEMNVKKRVILNAEQLAEKQKVSLKSVNILNNAVLDNITKAIMNADSSMKKLLNFSQVEQVLATLKIRSYALALKPNLSIVVFNNCADFSSNEHTSRVCFVFI